MFDKDADRLCWNLEFENQVAARHYEKLPDVARWQISNLLMVERSPSFCFYVQRSDSAIPRKSEKEVCDSFLDTRFARYSTTIRNYVGANGNYTYNPTPFPFPSPRVPVDQTARQIFKEATPEKTIGETFRELNINPTFHLVNNVRIRLTTPLYSYLKAVQDRKAEIAKEQ